MTLVKKEARTANSTYPKVAVHQLNKALYVFLLTHQ